MRDTAAGASSRADSVPPRSRSWPCFRACATSVRTEPLIQSATECPNAILLSPRRSIRASSFSTTTAAAKRFRRRGTPRRGASWNAQRLRPDDADVLNLLGLVYFKTNAFPEAEVIYRRLVHENSNVFILHSNLGLILFKQGKLDEAQRFLLRAIELRPNYAKSHLYLGLLYRQKKKLAEAIEHLK